MGDSEDRLEAIRAQARRQAAERAQAEAADRRREARAGRRNPKAERFTWVHFALALVVILAGSWLLLSREPKPDRDEFDKSLSETAQAVREYKNAAFAMAAIRELSSRGVRVNDAGAESVQHLSGNLYALTFSSAGEIYRIRGEYICDEGFALMPDNMVDPLCYRWR